MHVLYNEEGEIVHAYCAITQKENQLFVDVRGITDDFYGSFLPEFDDFITMKHNDGARIEVCKKYRQDCEHMDEAKAIISKYKDYYTLS